MDITENTVDNKWTEIELLPEWDEEFYDVYTAKKFGKWLMLKTLKPQYRGIEKYETMIEKEFDVRYNLAHAHIVMINDFEEVPGIGRCIITDDVYGTSLRKLIDEKRVKIIVDLKREHFFGGLADVLPVRLSAKEVFIRPLFHRPQADGHKTLHTDFLIQQLADCL